MTFDVLAVYKNTVRIHAEDKNYTEAYAIQSLGMASPDSQEEYFFVVEHGLYEGGGQWIAAAKGAK